MDPSTRADGASSPLPVLIIGSGKYASLPYLALSLSLNVASDLIQLQAPLALLWLRASVK